MTPQQPDAVRSADRNPARDLPPFWLAVLERARAEGDYATCADADRELRRLGVRIHYDMLRPTRQESRHA
jgi:hypothetical protein